MAVVLLENILLRRVETLLAPLLSYLYGAPGALRSVPSFGIYIALVSAVCRACECYLYSARERFSLCLRVSCPKYCYG
jgi:hypothetical protein